MHLVTCRTMNGGLMVVGAYYGVFSKVTTNDDNVRLGTGVNQPNHELGTIEIRQGSKRLFAAGVRRANIDQQWNSSGPRPSAIADWCKS
jgi:hypothetical protein